MSFSVTVPEMISMVPVSTAPVIGPETVTHRVEREVRNGPRRVHFRTTTRPG